MPNVSRVHPALAFALLALAGVSATSASAQPADGYIGPETSSEPQPAIGAKSGRYGGGGWSGDWRVCAEEGRRCTVRGWGVVRYGARGSFVYREVRNASLQCDNSMFGDPAFGRQKRCELRLYDDGGWQGGGDGDYGWTRCARENETCRVDGPATVRFGVDGRYYERRVRGGDVYCSIQTFGDPAPRERKVCELRYDAGGGRPGGGGGWGGGWNGGWTPCARENEVCRLPGPATGGLKYVTASASLPRRLLPLRGPARATVEAKLAAPQYKVEIAVVAAVGANGLTDEDGAGAGEGEGRHERHRVELQNRHQGSDGLGPEDRQDRVHEEAECQELNEPVEA
jgi:hypothetical protein